HPRVPGSLELREPAAAPLGAACRIALPPGRRTLTRTGLGSVRLPRTYSPWHDGDHSHWRSDPGLDSEAASGGKELGRTSSQAAPALGQAHDLRPRKEGAGPAES